MLRYEDENMFEIYDESQFEIYYYGAEYNCFIVFKKLTEEYYKVDTNKRRRALNVREHKFVTQKLKQLGWSD